MRSRGLMAMMLVVTVFPVAQPNTAEALPNCFGMAPTIVAAGPGLVTTGTAGNDVMLGTNGADTLIGGGGNDRICGLGGNDTLVGKNGTDRLDGGSGNDTLRGGRGNDRLFGRNNADKLILSEGNDKLNGGGGTDWFLGKCIAADWSTPCPFAPGKGLDIDFEAGIYMGGPADGTLKLIEKAKGTTLDDQLLGSLTAPNVLKGGPGADNIFPRSAGDIGAGGQGNDFMVSQAPFTILRGGGGDDLITAAFRSDADGGPGNNDTCTIGPGSTTFRCENHELLCGTGGSLLPAGLTDLTTATADFDGNGVNDDLQVYRWSGDWWLRIFTDSGWGSTVMLPTLGAEVARAIGGRDINQDGVAEALATVHQGAATVVVGFYTLHEPGGSPATGLTCDIEPVEFFGTGAEASWPVGATVGSQSGLVCGPGSITGINQWTGDGITYTHERWQYGYEPDYGTGPPVLRLLGPMTTQTLTRPGDDAVIDAVDFDCPPLTL